MITPQPYELAAKDLGGPKPSITVTASSPVEAAALAGELLDGGCTSVLVRRIASLGEVGLRDDEFGTVASRLVGAANRERLLPKISGGALEDRAGWQAPRGITKFEFYD